MITDPVDAPLESTLVMEVVTVIGAGWVMVTGTWSVQPLTSVTVKVYEPAVSPVCAGVMVYGPVPSEGVMITDPVDAPLHKTFVTAVVAVIAAGWVIVTGTWSVHPLASVTVKVYEPAASPVCAGVMVYGPVPPEGVMITDPVLAPLQSTLVIEVVTVIGAGWVIVTGTCIEQPLASVTVKVYEPAASPVCTGVMVYGPVPPVGVMITDPVLAPLHKTLVTAVVAVIAAG